MDPHTPVDDKYHVDSVNCKISRATTFLSLTAPMRGEARTMRGEGVSPKRHNPGGDRTVDDAVVVGLRVQMSL